MTIQELINNSLQETQTLIDEMPHEETYRRMAKLISDALLPDKTNLYNYTNYDIFVILIDYCNYNVYDHNTTISLTSEVESIVNSWTYSDVDTLDSICNPEKNDLDTVIDTIYKLKLNSNFVNYELRPAFRVLCNFLLFKHNIEQQKAKRINSGVLKIAYRNTDIEVLMKILREDVDKVCYDERMDLLQKRLATTLEVQEYLNSGKLYTLTEMIDDWHRYLEPNLLAEIYNIIFNNIQIEYNKASETNLQLTYTINRTPLVSYLYTNKINPKDVHNLKELNEIDYNILIKRIEFFKSLNIPLIEILNNYQEYLLTLKESTINTFTYYLNKNILSKETILKDITILNKELTIQTNYEILKPIIDFNNIYYQDTILLLNSRTLRDRISILKEYNLNQNNLTYLLANYNYLYIYDLLIENKIPTYLFINICKTYNPLLTIKKIIICQEINEPYETERHLLIREIRDINKFYIPDNEIDNYLNKRYIPNTKETPSINDITKDPIIMSLDESYRHGDVYIFDKVRISRPKVLKYLQTTKQDIKDNIYLAIITSSILSEEELLNIQYCLKKHFMIK